MRSRIIDTCKSYGLRDLRVDDNAALSEAVERGPVLPLYILEPDLWTGEIWELDIIDS